MPKREIFSSNTCDTPRSSSTTLDPEGADCRPDLGEATLSLPGSGDGDDLYSDSLVEDEVDLLNDHTRPLIYYQVEDLTGGSGELLLIKDLSRDSGLVFLY